VGERLVELSFVQSQRRSKCRDNQREDSNIN
jgi:hypothetical protein